MGYFRFFYKARTFYRPVPYPMNKKNKKILQIILKVSIYLVNKFHGNSVKNESARAKKRPSASLGLNCTKKRCHK